MSNEYEDDNTLAKLPTFKSNPGNRPEPGKEAPQAARPPVWESAAMADVREAIEAKARELGVSRHEAVTNTAMGAALDPQLGDRFYSALATYHGLPAALHGQPVDIHLDAKPGALNAALDGLKALDIAEPLTPMAAEFAPTPEPHAEVQPEPQAESAVKPDPAAAAAAAAATPAPAPASASASAGETVTMSREQYESLMRAAATVNAKKANGAESEVSPENLAEAVEGIRQGKPTPVAAAAPGVAKANVGQEAALLTQGMLGAGASLLGGVLKGSVGAVRKGIEAMRPDREADAAPGPVSDAPGKARPMVLPRLSEYRVSQIEDQANRYTAAQEAFWAAGKMPVVRKAIEEKSRETGMSVEDVMAKMKPGGEMHELHERFVEAYNQSPDASDHRKVMNKAIDGFVRQYGQAQEEMLAPEQQGNEYFDDYKDRVEGAKDRIFKKAGHVPLLDGEDKTHLQKLQEAVAKIIEKVREMVNGFTNMLRGKGRAEKEAVSEPAP